MSAAVRPPDPGPEPGSEGHAALALDLLPLLSLLEPEECERSGARTDLRPLSDAGRSDAKPADLVGIGRTTIAIDSPQLSAPAERLSLRSLDTYRVRQVEWLDKPFLQRSAFHLLAGRKGSCKGTVLCGYAARVSRGDLYAKPKGVLVVTSEDSVELDFLPRVLAAGGDPAKITIVNGPFRMPADIEWLEQRARELTDVGLILLDPIGNHLGGADTDKEGLVREAIAPLNPMADELDCMIIGVRHLGKDVSRGALSSVLGSTAWVDVPRCVILMAADDEDDRLFHAQVVAGNRGPRNAGRAFRLRLVDVPPATEITLAVAEGESNKNVEDLLGARSQSDQPTSRSTLASELILDILDQEGSQESDALDARVASETGIAAKTVRNLRGKLKTDGFINAYPQKDEDGTVARWMVGRTLAPRQVSEPEPARLTPPAQKPLEQASALPEPLESVSTGSTATEPEPARHTVRGPGGHNHEDGRDAGDGATRDAGELVA